MLIYPEFMFMKKLPSPGALLARGEGSGMRVYHLQIILLK
jgi:hypothetical protein